MTTNSRGESGQANACNRFLCVLVIHFEAPPEAALKTPPVPSLRTNNLETNHDTTKRVKIYFLQSPMLILRRNNYKMRKVRDLTLEVQDFAQGALNIY